MRPSVYSVPCRDESPGGLGSSPGFAEQDIRLQKRHRLRSIRTPSVRLPGRCCIEQLAIGQKTSSAMKKISTFFQQRAEYS